MNGINRVTLLGHLGADPELKHGQNTSVLRLRIATTETYKDKATNAWKEKSSWHSCVLFGQRAEKLSTMLAKGSQVYVEGKLETSSYDKDGQKVWRTDVIVQEIVLCGGRGTQQQAPATQGAQAPRERPASATQPATHDNFDEFGPGVSDDEIPF